MIRKIKTGTVHGPAVQARGQVISNDMYIQPLDRSDEAFPTLAHPRLPDGVWEMVGFWVGGDLLHMDTLIHRLAAADAPVLASFAETCFREAFGAHFGSTAMDALCAVACTNPVMEKLIQDGVWVAGDWQGYLALGEVPCPIPELTGPTLELARLYVRELWQGKGIADRLMERFLVEVAERQGRSVWLQAFAGNPRALAFYRRWGFADFGPYNLICEGIVLPHRLLGRNL